MEVTSKEQKRAEQLLQSQHIGLHQIKSFSFMKRYHQVPRKSNLAAKDKYGPGILTLHLKEGKEKVIYLPPFRHPSSVIRYLVSQEIPFDNYAPRERTVAEVPTETYQRPSLYMFWFFVLFLIFLILGYYSISGNVWWGFIPAIISFALSLFFISMLMTRFCYLTLDNNGLIIHSVGRTYPLSVPEPKKSKLRLCPRTEFHARHGIAGQRLPLPSVLYRKGFEKETE